MGRLKTLAVAAAAALKAVVGLTAAPAEAHYKSPRDHNGHWLHVGDVVRTVQANERLVIIGFQRMSGNAVTRMVCCPTGVWANVPRDLIFVSGANCVDRYEFLLIERGMTAYQVSQMQVTGAQGRVVSESWSHGYHYVTRGYRSCFGGGVRVYFKAEVGAKPKVTSKYAY